MRLEVTKVPKALYHGHPMNKVKYNETLKDKD